VGIHRYAALSVQSSIVTNICCILVGSKLLNPFGIFGGYSTDVRNRMISRYGYIPSPNSSSADGTAARNLGLFLSDFIVNFGPLLRNDEDPHDEQDQDGSVRELEVLNERDTSESLVLDISNSATGPNSEPKPSSDVEMLLEESGANWA
jgi:hypothetical protein